MKKILSVPRFSQNKKKTRKSAQASEKQQTETNPEIHSRFLRLTLLWLKTDESKKTKILHSLVHLSDSTHMVDMFYFYDR